MTTTIAKIYEALGGEADSIAVLTATGTLTASGDSPLIAAPGAGNRIVVTEICIQLEAATATTYLLKSGGSVIRRLRCVQDGDGIALVLPRNLWHVLAANTSLVLNCSAANATGYTIRYHVEAV